MATLTIIKSDGAIHSVSGIDSAEVNSETGLLDVYRIVDMNNPEDVEQGDFFRSFSIEGADWELK